MSKGMIFDVDGVLIYTAIDYPREIVKKIIKRLGYGEFSFKKVDRFWWGDSDVSRRELIELEFKVKFEDFIGLFEEYVRDFEHAKNFKGVYGEVIPVLDELKRRGISLGIVTDAPSYIAIPQLDYFFNDNYFSEIVMTHGLENVRDKPEPDGILLCMERMGVNDCAFIGDSDSDIVAAKKAGIEAILIDRGEHETYVEPDRKLKTLKELL